MKGIHIILSVINDLTGDQRVHRIASALQEAGAHVRVVGRKLPDSLPLHARSYRTHRMKLWFKSGKLFYLEYNIRLFFYLLWQKADILTANDLDTLLANFVASKIKRCKLVYDSHEYFTEVPELIDRPLTRKVWLTLEKFLFPRLKTVYTVNDSLAKEYEQLYGIPVRVIRNLPMPYSPPKMQSNQRIVIYQGALNKGRGIEMMIDAMTYLPGYELWLVGKGDVEEELKIRANNIHQGGKVVFKGFVPFEALSQITIHARLGLSLEEDMGANYHFASPNKIYDYIQANLPVLVSDLPEMRALIMTHGVGEVLAHSQRFPQALADAIKTIMEEDEKYLIYKKRCKEAAGILNWEKEKHLLLSIYRQISSKSVDL